jgi:pimeloyl-ACP methyl ester carboxylesterase
MTPPTVVLVHGAWADGSSWRKVITSLRETGIPVVAAPIPLTSLPDDVAALDRAVDRTGGPVVLVAHAYAGAVVGASRNNRVKALVYVAALAPAERETVADVFYRDPAHAAAPLLEPDAADYIWLPDDAFAAAFAQHASAEEQAVLAAVQRPISVTCIQQPVPTPRWKTLPSWYLLAAEDRMINPRTQAFMAERMGAQIRSHQADHTPMVTEPAVVTDLITEAYGDVAGKRVLRNAD